MESTTTTNEETTLTDLFGEVIRCPPWRAEAKAGSPRKRLGRALFSSCVAPEKT